MAVFKCKMCGGALEVHNNESVAECEYCGTKQTLPTNADEVITNLFNRANNLRMKCEFDKAMQIYEKIVERDDSEAEAHWGIVLCKYGIEYVEDPQTMVRIPTCHRTSFESITKDMDYIAAIDYSDSLQQVIYEKEAREIDKIQKDILAVVNKEEPFDIFICYKETDENGKRTVDSVIANDIYHQLTQEGFKVFYAAITLEDKLGQEYEPYIFAALNSAKVMLAIGTKPEYFNAVWVKNEWSRFMNFMKTERSKLLIPCYRDMDAYDLPEEFAHLQAQDMSKIGFINDVVRGIKKVIDTKEENQVRVQERVLNGYANNVEPLLKRAFMFLEDGEWQRADELCEQVLNQEPDNAYAYLGKLMAERHVRTQEGLGKCLDYSESMNYQKVIRFADDELRMTVQGYAKNNENRIKNVIYCGAKEKMDNAQTEGDYQKVYAIFEKIKEYMDSEGLMRECQKQIKIIQCQQVYEDTISKMHNATSEQDFLETAKLFDSIGDYKDAAELSAESMRKAKEIAGKLSHIKELLRKIKLYVLEEIQMLNESTQQLKERRETLEKEKSDLGFFERKKAKEIENQILDISTRSRHLRQKESLLKNDFERYICDNENMFQIYKELSNEVQGNEYLKKYLDIWMLQKGDTFSFGIYVFDPRKKNFDYEYEEIQWMVLEVQEDKMLVMSKDVLCVREFDEKYVRQNPETWETSLLRRWLNNEFLNENFSNIEKDMIIISDVVCDSNSKFHTWGGMDTQDKIFLPSAKECDEYKIPMKPGVTSIAAREYRSQEYFSERDYGGWWLRSIGKERGYFEYVAERFGESFDISNHGAPQTLKLGVRPAMWINLLK